MKTIRWIILVICCAWSIGQAQFPLPDELVKDVLSRNQRGARVIGRVIVIEPDGTQNPARGAIVTIPASGLQMATDDHGMYRISGLQRIQYTLTVAMDGCEKISATTWAEYEGIRRPLKQLYLRRTASSAVVRVTAADASTFPGEVRGYPVQLSAVLSLEEPSGNNILDAGERGAVVVKIRNGGKGTAHNLQVTAASEGTLPLGIEIGKAEVIRTLGSGAQAIVRVPLLASENIASANISLKIDISEAHGFDLEPSCVLRFSTARLQAPNIVLSDVSFDDQSGNGRIEPREMTEILARIQNRGKGAARAVNVLVTMGDNMYMAGDSYNFFEVGDLKPGEYKDIRFSGYSNSRAEKFCATLKVQEARQEFTKSLLVALDLSKPTGSAVVATAEPKEEPSLIAAAPNVSVDVDNAIPIGATSNPKAVAVVIGVSRYQNNAVPTVDYARRDAAIMREYLIRTFGYDERRIITLIDEEASLSRFRQVFNEQLPNSVRQGNTDVFVYFSGHGVPDVDTKEAYFVPYDCNPMYPKSTGFALKDLYASMSKLKARSVTLVIDACFSGAGVKGSVRKQISPIGIPIDNPVMMVENGSALLACTGTQVAGWYAEKKHGLFTYFFMKALRGEADADNNCSVTVEEVSRFLQQNVPDYARSLSNIEQTPVIVSSNNSRELVRLKGR